MSEVPIWNCEFKPSPDPGAAALDQLTVGHLFQWQCHGDIAVDWPKAPPRLVFPQPEGEYSLSVQKINRLDANDVLLTVTSYKPGAHAPEYVRFLVGQGTDAKGFEVVKPQWTVKSVLDPQQPPQPVPPFGPWSLSLPLWLLSVCVIVILLVLWLTVRRIRKSIQRKRMLETLQKHKTALPPLHQFYKDARQIRRRLNQLKDPNELKTITSDLNQEFRMFVLRQFQIPALEWSDRAILEEMRRRHLRIYKTAKEPLRRTLRELRMLAQRSEIDLKDIEQMHRMSLDTAETLQVPDGHR